jgi:hypothetical protein
MSRSIRYSAVPLVLAFALAAGACGDHGKTDTLAQDSTLNRDLALANSDTAAQPQLSDTATAPAEKPEPAKPAPVHRTPPRTSTPKPKPKPKPEPPKPVTTASGNTVETGAKGSAPSVGSIGAGSLITMSSNQRICTNTNKPGDRFTATVTEPVVGANGAVIPKGARAVIQVSSLHRSENATDPVKMGFLVQSVTFGGTTYPVNSDVTDVQVEKVRSTSTSSDAKKVVGGAIAGAIIGQVLGKDTKSTVIGAATGAAAGTAVAMGTANYEGCIPDGGKIQVKLAQPVVVQMD